LVLEQIFKGDSPISNSAILTWAIFAAKQESRNCHSIARIGLGTTVKERIHSARKTAIVIRGFIISNDVILGGRFLNEEFWRIGMQGYLPAHKVSAMWRSKMVMKNDSKINTGRRKRM
jgi:hypothetical protein